MGYVIIFIPEKNIFIKITEGTGDNLLKEDIENGYVDYINYEIIEADEIEFGSTDGGMLLRKKLLREEFSSLKELIPTVLAMAFDEKDIPYVMLCEEKVKGE